MPQINGYVGKAADSKIVACHHMVFSLCYHLLCPYFKPKFGAKVLNVDYSFVVVVVLGLFFLQLYQDMAAIFTANISVAIVSIFDPDCFCASSKSIRICRANFIVTV